MFDILFQSKKNNISYETSFRFFKHFPFSENKISELEQISLLAVSISHIEIKYCVTWLGRTEFQLMDTSVSRPFGRVCDMKQF